MKKEFEVEVPEGAYWLGDPCYAVRGDDWDVLLNSCNFFDNPVGEIKGFKVYASSTAYGDGVYPGLTGVEYPVDAGLIGLVPVEYVEQARATDTSLDGMRRITLTKPTTFWYVDGTIGITGIEEIQTSGYSGEEIGEEIGEESNDDAEYI